MKMKFNKITAVVLMFAAISVNQVVAGAAAAPRLFFAGDSTLDDAGFSLSGRFRDPYRSWGTMLLNWMKPECGVANYARSGASTKSFVKSGLWDKLIADVKPGDFVAIQFGHNDQKRSNDFYRENRWADPNGLFREIVRGWVKDVRAKGATPLLLSPIRRATFDKDGEKLLDKASRGVCLRSYRDAMQELSVELGCDFIDMNEMTKQLMESIGRDESYRFFVISTGLIKGKDGEPSRDTTHPIEAGAKAFAKLFVDDVKKRNLSVARLFRDDGETSVRYAPKAK
jgi:lysophospholipase L1-like esterase